MNKGIKGTRFFVMETLYSVRRFAGYGDKRPS